MQSSTTYFFVDDGKIRRFARRNGGKHGEEIVKDREATRILGDRGEFSSLIAHDCVCLCSLSRFKIP